MSLMHSMRLACWLLCGVYAAIPLYWMLVHSFSEEWRRCRYKWQALVFLWIAICCAAWGISYPWRMDVVHPGPEGWAVAPFLGTFSLILYTRSARELTLERLLGLRELRRGSSDALVTDGVYEIVRHPMYLGHLATMFTATLGAATVACMGLFAFTLIAGGLMIFLEERELHRRFGPAWERYCKQTPALIPRIKP